MNMFLNLEDLIKQFFPNEKIISTEDKNLYISYSSFVSFRNEKSFLMPLHIIETDKKVYIQRFSVTTDSVLVIDKSIAKLKQENSQKVWIINNVKEHQIIFNSFISEDKNNEVGIFSKAFYLVKKFTSLISLKKTITIKY